jgi:hypothetical protein
MNWSLVLGGPLDLEKKLHCQPITTNITAQSLFFFNDHKNRKQGNPRHAQEKEESFFAVVRRSTTRIPAAGRIAHGRRSKCTAS